MDDFIARPKDFAPSITRPRVTNGGFVHVIPRAVSQGGRGKSCKFRVELPVRFDRVIGRADRQEGETIGLARNEGVTKWTGTIADVVVVSFQARRGRKVSCGVILRQKRAWRRGEGIVSTNDDAGIVLYSKASWKQPIVGGMARECAERWPGLVSIAASVL